MIISNKAQELKVSKYLSVYDFIYLCLFFVIAVVLVLVIYKTNHVLSIITSLMLFTILSIGLIKYNDVNVYYRIYLVLNYLLTKYTKQKRIHSYKIVENNVARIYKNQFEYLSCFKIKGFDFFNYDENEREKQITILKTILDTIDQQYYFIKIDERINLIENAKWLNESALESSSNYSNTILNMYIDKMISKEEDSLKHKTSFTFYLIAISKNKKELSYIESNLVSKFIESKLNVTLCDKYHCINVLKTLLDPTILNYPNQTIDNNKDDLSDLLNYSKVTIKKNYLKSDKLYLSINTIKPKLSQLSHSWLWPFILSDTNTVISSSIVKSNVSEKQITKSIMNLKTTLHYVSKKEIATIQKLELLIEEYEIILKNIASNIDKVRNINISFINYALNKKELLEKHYEIKTISKNNNFEFDELNYLQKDSLGAITLSIISNRLKQKNLLTSNYDLALSYPYIDNLLIDNNGCYLGTEIYSNQPIIFDPLKIDDKHRNNNMIVLGSSGNGKTTFIKKLVEFNLSANRNVIIIDPENEYNSICENFKGSNISASDKFRTYEINPFQIMYSGKYEPYSDVYGVNKNIIKDHIEFISTWFQTLYPKLDWLSIHELKWIIEMLYDKTIYQTSYLYEIKDNEWPDYCELNSLIDEVYKEENQNNMFMKLYKTLKSDFNLEDKASNHRLYRNSNRIEINNSLTVVDTSNFFETYSKDKIYGTLFLLMKDIFTQIKRNKNNSDKKTLIVIDEAHIFLDSKNMIMTDFIYQMVKRIRKYNAGIILITQNINDLIADKNILKETTAILNNIQYSVMFNLQANDLDNLSKLYSQTQIITEQDKKNIYNFKKGQMMLLSQGSNKVFVDIELLKDKGENNGR